MKDFIKDLLILIERWSIHIVCILFLLFICITRCESQIGYIECSPFPSKCLITCEDFNKTEEWLKKDTVWRDSMWYLEGDFAGSYSFTNYIDPPGQYPCFIIVFDSKPTDDLEGHLLVGHEVIHLIQFLYEAYSVDFLTERESTAYLFEYLVNQIYNVINK